MICAICQADMLGRVCACGWKAPAQPAEVKTVAVYKEPLIDRDEFGPTLYRVIALFAEREQVRKRQAHEVYKNERVNLAWYKSQDKDLTDAIVALMPELDPKDQTRLMDRFEPRKAG
jgi:hypothetical protein